MPSSQLIHKVNSVLQGLFPSRDLASLKFVIGVSGGADSMALLHVITALKIPIAVAHINYKQRGDESDADEKLVADYCLKHSMPFHSKVWGLGKSVPSFQEKAREFRYQFFESIKSSEKCDAILTAHHEKDRIESFLYNLARGAGLDGVNSLAKKNGDIVRPFFDVNKAEIEQYLDLNKVIYRDDKSNFESKYTRNFIRLEILPKLEQIHPSASENLIGFLNRSAKAVEEINAIYSRVLDAIQIQYSHQTLNVSELDLSDLNNQVKDIDAFFVFVLKRLDIEFHRNGIASLTELALNHNPESKIVQFGAYTFEFFKSKLYIVSGEYSTSESITISNIHELLELISTTKEVNVTESEIVNFEKGHLYLSLSELKFPLRLENTTDGDKIKLFGMGGRAKKVSDLLTEASYPQWKKKISKVLWDADNEIVVTDWSRHSEKVAYHKNCQKTIIIS